MQLGSSNALESISFTTSNIPGIIKSISVDCASKGGNHTLSISVDGTSYFNGATPSWSSNSGAVKTGTGNKSGEIEISFTNSATSAGNALYVKSISVTYTSGSVTPTVKTPQILPAGGTYTTAQSVTISCETEDATIHYTTNGDEPTESDATYSTAISVTTTGTVLKAKAFKDGMNASSVATETYGV